MAYFFFFFFFFFLSVCDEICSSHILNSIIYIKKYKDEELLKAFIGLGEILYLHESEGLIIGLVEAENNIDAF